MIDEWSMMVVGIKGRRTDRSWCLGAGQWYPKHKNSPRVESAYTILKKKSYKEKKGAFHCESKKRRSAVQLRALTKPNAKENQTITSKIHPTKNVNEPRPTNCNPETSAEPPAPLPVAPWWERKEK